MTKLVDINPKDVNIQEKWQRKHLQVVCLQNIRLPQNKESQESRTTHRANAPLSLNAYVIFLDVI